MNKIILKILSSTACLLFLFSSNTFALEAPSSNALSVIQNDQTLNWTKLPTKEDVAIDKVWSIKLTQVINGASLSNYPIYIMDDKFNIVDTSFKLSEDSKTINVLPSHNYSPGHSYCLYVTNRITSVSNCSLFNPTCMNFTINADAVKVDYNNNNQSIEIKKNDIIELTLPENYDGGYSWDFKPTLDNNMFKIIDDIFIWPDVQPDVVGGIGKKRWLIKAVGTGTGSLNLQEYRRWDADSIVSTFNLKISVK